MEVITIEPLLSGLDGFSVSAGPRKAPIIHGDDFGHLVPVLKKLILSKDFKVFTLEESAFMMLEVGMQTGHTECFGFALTMIAQKGRAGGTTAHSNHTEFIPNFCTFDFDHLPPNTQTAIVIHELGHVLTPLEIVNARMEGPQEDKENLCEMECIAYAVEFAVCKALGFDALENCLHGLASYGVQPERLRKHKELIQSISSEVLAWISKNN